MAQFEQQIVVSGENEALATWDRIGKTIVENMNNAAAAVAQVNEQAASLGEAAVPQVSGAMDKFNDYLKSIGRLGKGIGGPPALEAGQGWENYAKGAEGAFQANENFAQTLRTLGRAAHIPVLGQLSSAIKLVTQSAFGVPLAIGAAALAFGTLAKSAADAAEKMQQSAAKMRMTPDAYQDATRAGTALGVSQDDMASSLEAVDKGARIVGDSMKANEKNYWDAYSALQQFDKEAEHANDTQRATQKWDRYTEDVAGNYRAAKEALDTYNAGLRWQQLRGVEITKGQKVQRERLRGVVEARQDEYEAAQTYAAQQKQIIANNERLYQQEQKREALARKLDEAARAEVETRGDRMAEGLAKLGVSAYDASGKLRAADEVMYEVADGLKAMGDGEKRASVEMDLVAGGLNRKLLPGLRQGREGYKKFIDEGLKILPKQTPAQLEALSEYGSTLQRLGDTWKGYSQEVGAFFAKPLTGMMKAMTPERLLPLGTALADPIITAAKAAKMLGSEIASIDWSQIQMPSFEGLKSAWGSAVDWVKSHMPVIDFDVPSPLESVKASFDTIKNAWGQARQWIEQNAPKISIKFPDIMGWINQAKQYLSELSVRLGIQFPDIIGWVNQAKQYLSNLMVTLGIQFPDVIGWINQARQWLSQLNVRLGIQFPDVWGWISQAKQWLSQLSVTLGIQFPDLYGWWNAFKQYVMQPIQASITVAVNYVKQAISPSFAPGGGITQAGIERLRAGETITGPSGEKLAFASGGLLRGPGGGTSDSFLIRASRGEYVVRAAAVSKYGTALLNAINSMRLSGFDGGGLLDSLQVLRPRPMRFADGGMVPAAAGGRTLNLTIGGDTFAGLIAPETVVQKLTRVATKTQLRSTGRKPSWVR